MFKVQSSEDSLAMLYVVNFYVRVTSMSADAGFHREKRPSAASKA